jgi:hypothetical protein
MICRRATAIFIALAAASVSLADVVVMKSGEKITGRVIRFENNKASLASSHFVVDVDGEEKEFPLFKIDTVTFSGPLAAERPDPAPFSSAITPPVAARPPARKPSVSEESAAGGGYWLSSTGKRHNSSCRYYKSSKGRPCGKNDGVACKSCGG